MPWLVQSALCRLYNLLIKGYVSDSTIEPARAIFESLTDTPSSVAAPATPYDPPPAPPVSPGSVSYREVS